MSELHKLVQQTRKRFMLALLIIALISTASFIVLHYLAQTQESDASIINDAGRQRMLSQRIALGVSQLINQLNQQQDVQPYTTDIITHSANLLLNSHETLLQISNNEEVQQLYHSGDPSLDTELRHYVKSALSIAQAKSLSDISPSDLTYFETENVSYLLFRLNVMVISYEEAAQAKLESSKFVAALLWFILLAALFLEFKTIFKPTLELIRKSFALQDMKQRRMQLAADSAQLGIWEFDITNNTLHWDKKMWLIFYESEPKSDVITIDTFKNCLHPEDKTMVMDAFNRALTEGNELNFSFRIFSPKRTIKHIQVHSIIETNDSNALIRIVGTNQDITEQVLKEDALIIEKEKAEAATRIKGDFLASMSHEIRTPLNGVMGMLGLLKNTPLNDLQLSRLEIALSSAQSLLALINDILDFSKIEAEKLQIETIDFDLNKLLSEIIDSLAQLAEERQIELILDTVKLTTNRVMGDPNRIRQMLVNILSNAIKFTHEGHVILSVELIPSGNKTWQFNFSVEDTGIGIPEEKQIQLFDAFSQVDTSITRKYGGTGLGLAIVKRLCLAMSGNINVSSQEGRGSRFYGNILLGESHQSQVIAPNFDVSQLNLLIVDDNSVNLTIMHDQLTYWKVQVTCAHSASQAISLCESRLAQGLPIFDIAILDMQMPNMNGLELGNILKQDKRFKSMHLVLMTSMMMNNNREDLANAGFSGCFSKPVTNSDLFLALSVIGEDGEALHKAPSLITHDYLRDLQTPDKDSSDTNLKDYVNKLENKDILLVEDNSINQLVASEILEGYGFNIFTADDGILALTQLNNRKDKPYQLIFMDCQMPRMDGFSTTREIRAGKAGQLHLDTPIIALTANAMAGDQQKCLDAGMNDFISKPIDEQHLKRIIHSWLFPHLNNIN